MTKKKWLIAFSLLLLLGGTGMYGLGLFSHQNETVAIVEKDGKVLYRFELQKITDTHTYTIGHSGEENDITVSPEGICVSHADCPDQTCVKQGVRAHGPTPIVCLPHHLTIRFTDSANNTLDATTGQ